MVRATVPGGSVPPAPDAATSETAALGVNTASGAAETVRNAIRTAAAPFRSVISTFNARSKHLFSNNAQDAGAVARVTGVVPRIDPVDDSYAVLLATRPIGALTPAAGIPIQAGSFTVNGVLVDVAADDTVANVLLRVTASDAGVTAMYDAVTHKVSLAAKSGIMPIELGPDSSGFLDAVKLDGTAQAGTQQRTRSALATALGVMSEYAAVQPGAMTVNGQQIPVDPATTTINGLVAALNATADMSATVEEGTGEIVIASRLPGATITLADSSGLLSALSITAGTYSGTAVDVAAKPAPMTGDLKVSSTSTPPHAVPVAGADARFRSGAGEPATGARAGAGGAALPQAVQATVVSRRRPDSNGALWRGARAPDHDKQARGGQREGKGEGEKGREEGERER